MEFFFGDKKKKKKKNRKGHILFIVLENLNPLTVTHLIFFSPCCSFLSIVWIYFDLKHHEVIQV